MVTDYYKELTAISPDKFQFLPNDSLDVLQRKLGEFATLWQSPHVEANRPADTMRARSLLIYAREKFNSEESRCKYDQELELDRQSSQQDNSSSDGDNDFVHWYSEARKYYSNGNYDLAKAVSIEH